MHSFLVAALSSVFSSATTEHAHAHARRTAHAYVADHVRSGAASPFSNEEREFVPCCYEAGAGLRARILASFSAVVEVRWRKGVGMEEHCARGLSLSSKRAGAGAGIGEAAGGTEEAQTESDTAHAAMSSRRR
jgi:hypothetical protein